MQWKITALGLAFVVSAGAGMAHDYLGERQAQAQAQAREAESGRQANMAKVLPQTPTQVLSVLHSMISQGNTKSACLLMDEPTRATFAAAHAAPDCETAVRGLSAQVKHQSQYLEYSFVDRKSALTGAGDVAGVDGCAIEWRPGLLDTKPVPQGGPGPRVGRLELRRIGGGGWLIVGYQRCPTAALDPRPSGTGSSGPPVTSSARPSTTRTSAPPLLPSYPAAFGSILAANLATGGDGASACAVFSPAGAAQFAAAHGAASCAAAAAKLAGQITDTRRYRAPRGAVESKGPRGPVIDACHLNWPSLQPAPAPGPQIGRLELEAPAGSAGYWITGYRRC